jgi:hypothetical protein
MVAMHLEPYGYMVATSEDWKDTVPSSASRPHLRLALAGHTEMDSHTYYSMECELTGERPPLQLAWQSQKRLGQLREELHDTVKNELGSSYPEIFALAPFAKRGGWSGTSERLKRWLEVLAECVNKGTAPPILVSQVLLFFDAPAQPQHEASAQAVPEVLELAEEETSASNLTPSAGSPAGSEASTDRSLCAERHVPASMEEVHEIDTTVAARCGSTCTDSQADSQAERSNSTSKVEATAAPHRDGDTMCYLESFGFAAGSLAQWKEYPSVCVEKPLLAFNLEGHCEQNGHTYYKVQCTFTSVKTDRPLEWKVQRRLAQLREELHDTVKDGLGKTYAVVFSQAPFARRGGLSGTTGRLQTWLETLAYCINDRLIQPCLVARMLQSLEIPLPPQMRVGLASPRRMQEETSQVSGYHSTDDQTIRDSNPFSDIRDSNPFSDEQAQPPLVSDEPSSCNTACSPIKTEQPRWALRHDTDLSDPAECGAMSDDEENASEVPAQFSPSQRRRGYKRLRDWFAHLRRSLEKRF